MTPVDWLKQAKEDITYGSFRNAIRCINEVIELLEAENDRTPKDNQRPY